MEDKSTMLSELEESIGYHFSNVILLTEALSHSSYVNELRIRKTPCYERLEFLGDAVLELVSSDRLFDQFEAATEGELSKRRAALVCEKSLSACARRLQLGRYILLGRGEARNNGGDRDSILCDVIEAVIGAIYRDGGLEPAKKFITDHILSADCAVVIKDNKTALQEYVQAQKDISLHYVTVTEGGVLDSLFEVEVYICDSLMGKGTGVNRKDAEQMAAGEALEKLKGKD